jgi:putative proteasome-type protease
MTYGLGMLLDAGLVLVADTRTNAGVDNVSSYRKLHCLAHGPDREIHVACSGSLSASQAALGLLLEGDRPDGEAISGARSGGFDVRGRGHRRRGSARGEPPHRPGACPGSEVRRLHARRRPRGDGPPRLFLVYEEGNFIECKSDAPFLQIGETKYGRPILDRTIRPSTPLPAAVKIALLSFDSAMRSNLAVARPLDMMVMPSDPRQPTFVTRIEKDDPYFNTLSARWSDLLVEATMDVPDPDFMSAGIVAKPLSVVAGTSTT